MVSVLRTGALLVFLLTFSDYAFGQYQLDTLSHRPVGPGMVHTHVIEPNRPWNIHIFTADLTNPYLEVESAKAHNRLRALERTSLQAARRDFPGHRIAGGVNGDFYAGGGEPISIQVLQGEVLKKEAPGRTAVGFTPQNSPMMGIVSFSGALLTTDESLPIHGVNEERDADELILYNSYVGSSTATNQFGTEAALNVLDPWLVNDTLRAVVTNLSTGTGDMDIPEGRVVVSGHGTASDALQALLEEGDTLALIMNVEPAPGKIKEMVGGGPMLIIDGTIDIGPRGDGGVRHPRTAVGFSADSTKLILATVDGRQSISVGMTLHELATLMHQAGAAYAMNLDGGGSTTMLVGGDVVNSTSDTGGERTVSNSLLLFSTAPLGPLNAIRLPDQMLRLFRGRTHQFDVEGIDEHFNPVPLDSSLLSFDADADVGTIDEEGRFEAAASADTGYVRVTYGDFSDSTLVIIKDIARLALDPSSILTDTLETVAFSVSAYDTDNVQQGVPAGDFTWTTTDLSVGTVDAQGRFRGHAPGLTSVVAAYGELTDTAYVTVEVYGGYSLLDSLDTISGWSLTGENVDMENTQISATDSVASLGSHAIRLDYRHEPTQDPSRVYLNHMVDVNGLPDSIFVDVLSSESGHRVFFEAIDSDGDTFTFYPLGRRPDLSTDEFGTLVAPFKAYQMRHPIRFARIGVQLAASAGSEPLSGTILFDNLRVSYPGHTDTAAEADEIPATSVVLHPNYPNPFRDRTMLSYELATGEHVSLEIFDLLGRVVRVVERGPRRSGRHEVAFEADGLPSGVYFVRLQAGGATRSRAISVVR